MYAGALDEPTSQYANKVFAEKARLDALQGQGAASKPRNPPERASSRSSMLRV